MDIIWSASSYSTCMAPDSELASTHMFSCWLSMHQSPWAGSSCCTESTVSDTMCWRRVSFVLSSQPFVTKFALLLSIMQATRSQPHIRRCPTSLPHREYCLSCDNTRGVKNHASLPPSQLTLFYHDHQSQHSCTILQLFQVFTF